MALLAKTLKNIPIKQLKLAKFNPASRQLDIKSLCASIERVGLLCPVTITKGFEVADGHRRIAAYKKLGWTEIPCVVAEGSLPDLFSEINGQAKRLTGTETIEVFLLEPNAIATKARNQLVELQELAGRAMLERMVKGRFTLGTWTTAKAIVNAADIEDDQLLLKALRWIMKYRCARSVRRAMQMGTAPSKLVAAIKNDKVLRISYTTT